MDLLRHNQVEDIKPSFTLASACEINLPVVLRKEFLSMRIVMTSISILAYLITEIFSLGQNFLVKANKYLKHRFDRLRAQFSDQSRWLIVLKLNVKRHLLQLYYLRSAFLYFIDHPDQDFLNYPGMKDCIQSLRGQNRIVEIWNTVIVIDQGFEALLVGVHFKTRQMIVKIYVG